LELGDVKKTLGIILLILITVQLASAWSGGTYIKNDANKIHSLSTIDQYKEPIRVDANGDGDIEDEGDYVIYNELYVLAGSSEAEVRLVYSVDPPSAFSASLEDFPGSVVEIKGKRYLITKALGGVITMGEPREITLKKYPTYDPAEAVTVTGDLKFELVDSTSGSTLMGMLYVIEGDTVLGSIDMDRDHSSGQFPNGTDMFAYLKDLTGVLDGYKVFLTDARPRKTKFALVKEDELFEIRDRDTNVFGYSEVKINDDEFGSGSNKGTGKIKLLGETYVIKKDDEVKVTESESYRLQFNDANKIRLTRYSFPVTNETIKERLANESAKIVSEWRSTSIKTYSDKILVLDDYGPDAIWVDGNTDGDLRDEEDYVLYNQLYVLDGSLKGDIRLIYNLEAPKLNEITKGPFGSLIGQILPIGGKGYLVTKAEETTIVLGENPVNKSLRKVESADVSNIVNFVEDIGMLRVGDPEKSSLGELYIYKGETVLGSFELSSTKRDLTFSISQVTDALDDYKVILANNSAKHAAIAMVKNEDLTTIRDESANVFGYEKVYVNNDEFPEGLDRVKFLSRLYSIEKDEETPLDENPDVYTLQYNKYGEFRVKKDRFLAKEEPKETNETDETDAKNETEVETPRDVPPPIVTGTGGSLLELLKAERDSYNEYMETAEIPGVLRSFASGRYIVHVDDETVGIVLEDGMITEVRDGGIGDPTTEIWTNRDYFDKIYASDGALGLIVAGLANGEIEKKDYGVGGKLKGRAGLAGMRLSEVFNPTRITLTEEEAKGEIKGLTKSVVKGTYAMNPATSKLRRTHIEMKSKEGEDIGDKEIEVKEYAGYKEGKAPKGLNKWESIEGETSLGTFVEIKDPLCGDGNTDAGEECDDGNHMAGDGCTPDCKLEVKRALCGDGILDAGLTLVKNVMTATIWRVTAVLRIASWKIQWKKQPSSLNTPIRSSKKRASVRRTCT
jgi:cysteine-rich repeat protein